MPQMVSVAKCSIQIDRVIPLPNWQTEVSLKAAMVGKLK